MLPIISKQCNEYREIVVRTIRRARGNVVQIIPFLDSNRDGDARSCPGTAVHAFGAHPNRTHP